jgi:MFS family permease
MPELAVSIHKQNRVYRAAVSSLFFLQGLCFATWASRIPSIQQSLGLTDASLGVILFSLPIGSLLALPFAGWLVTRFGSKRIASNALFLYSIVLVTLGLAQNVPVLILGLVLFGIAGNTANIAINTQAVGVELKYSRNIMASFHGLWSLAGFTAAGIGTFMMGRTVRPLSHFLIITIAIIGALIATYQYLLPNEEKAGSATSKKIFVRPGKTLLKLGLIAFCCMLCEGAMFDWSGIYFQKVVKADKAWVGAGYTAFMFTMAAGRFVADRVSNRLGFQKTIQLSGLLIATGLSISVLFPLLTTAIAGFFIVGFGVSSVVPLVYSEAGKSKTLSPGMALAAVSSIGFLGFLAGPPLIGVVAGLSSLRLSFSIIAVIGMVVMVLVRRRK